MGRVKKKRVNYYPFGLHQKRPNIPVNGRSHQYRYNNTELEEGLGLNWYEMPLRSFDPIIARWNRIDPITHHTLSTYNTFGNNPVYYNDPSGGSHRVIREGRLVDPDEYAKDPNAHAGYWSTEEFKNRDSNNGGNTVTVTNYGTNLIAALQSLGVGFIVTGDLQSENPGQPKYQVYNVVPFNSLYIDNELNPYTFNSQTGYGEDPKGLHADKTDAILTLLGNLTDKGKIKLLRSLGVSLKAATGILKKLEILSADPFAIYNDGLGALPGIGPIVGSYSDQFNSEQRAIENEVKWDNVRSSFDGLMDQSDLTNVILIYTNENLFQTDQVKGSDMEVLQDRYPTKDYKYIYYGTQTGDNLFIFGQYENQY